MGANVPFPDFITSASLELIVSLFFFTLRGAIVTNAGAGAAECRNVERLVRLVGMDWIPNCELRKIEGAKKKFAK